MLEFFNKNNINRSKKLLSTNFNKAINHKIFTKSNHHNLLISSYNIHYFLPPLKSQNAISKHDIMSGLKNLIHFCNKSKSDIILLQEALFNDKIIAYFRENNFTPYVCDTYEIINKNKLLYYYGNITLIKNNPNLKIKTVSKTISLSGFHQRKKCIVNLNISYLSHNISIYNIHLDVWDRTGKCRLEQIKNILNLIQKDPCNNILLGGDFNSIKNSNYNKSQSQALKNFYNLYTNNPFKEINFLEKKKFTNITNQFPNKISSTVWSKQRVDFFFIRNGFSIPISHYHTHHIKGSDHYPISIELSIQENCINIPLLTQPLISNKNNISISFNKQLTPNKKLIFQSSNKCPVIIKILPIWNNKWKNLKNILHNYNISNSLINYGKKSAYNEFIISKYMSKLVEKCVTFSFVKTLAAFETENIPIDSFHLLDIPNQKFYILVQPLLQNCEINPLFKKYQDLVIFQLQWALFISYKRFQFIHGDIYHGTKNNILCTVLNLYGKKYIIIKYKNLIWKFPFNGILPIMIMFDFEFSDFQYKNINIHNKIPTTNINNYPIGENNTINKKRELDILGLNKALKKIGIHKKIPQISPYNNKQLLNGFDKYKINEDEFSKLDKNIYFLFDGSSKKI